MSDRNSYTVGWICAITTEFVAARTMLDEEHESPEYDIRNDNNSYKLGRIGRHNVAIAVLPDGEYGTNSATAVARDMVRTFPNIRIGFMVGIGGGVPSQRHDIRLGDVVVSSPSDSRGGVYQYDFGKTIQDQKFNTTGHLNQPPSVIRTAVSSLKSDHELYGAHLEDIIGQALTRNPRIRRKYRRQDTNSDRLYHPKVVHPNNGASCIGHCDSEQSNWIPRPLRGEFDDNPAIHYGLIASANQLMKDANVRDKLAREQDVLCFEMEAAGLMNQFPCLVIRGICDYADTHKNDNWQGYAAMAAAAYTRELLSKIAPSRVEAERKLAEAIALVDKDFKKIKSLVLRVNDSVQNSSSYQRDRDIQEWLEPRDPSLNFENAIKLRHVGSGSWLLRHQAFLDCLERQSSCLLGLFGIPGCGKTVASTTMIEALQARNTGVPVLYFYFDFNDGDKQTLEGLIRSLISQLSSQQERCRKKLESAFSHHFNGKRRPSCDNLRKIFLDMLKSVYEAWIVIDALDESKGWGGGSDENVQAWLNEILCDEAMNIHIVVTSRPNHDIITELCRLRVTSSTIYIQGEELDRDIHSYARFRLQNDPGLRRWQIRQEEQEEYKLQKEIEDTVLHKADGMFRLVACRLDILQECLSIKDLRTKLTSLPKDLDEVYGRILSKIPSNRVSSAIRILQLLLFSPRPLNISEINDAVAVDIKKEPHFDVSGRLRDKTDVALYCSGLTSVFYVMPYVESEGHVSDESDQTLSEDSNTDCSAIYLRLAHSSVEEYLLSENVPSSFRDAFHEQAANLTLAEVCVTYLLQIQKDLIAENIRSKFPFAQYCSNHWYIFAAVSRTEPDTLHLKIMQLLKLDSACFRNLGRLFKKDLPFPDKFSRNPVTPGPLHITSFAGLFLETRTLLEQGTEVNASCGPYGTALHGASYTGHTRIVQMLLEHGSDINADCREYGSALQAASSAGNGDIVQILLNHGADINADSREYGFTPQVNSKEEHRTVLRAFLDLIRDNYIIPGEKTTSVDGDFDMYGTALQCAAEEGHHHIVQMLLDQGADVNAQSRSLYCYALHAACFFGHDRIVKMLLDWGADPNAKGNIFNSALHSACHGGDSNDKIVQILLERGANINRQNKEIVSGLELASRYGYANIVKVLLNWGASLSDRSRALGVASSKGHSEIVEMIRAKNSNYKKRQRMISI